MAIRPPPSSDAPARAAADTAATRWLSGAPGRPLMAALAGRPAGRYATTMCRVPLGGALLAAALAVAAGPAAAQSAVIMGRLFASPQERAALDAQRNAVLGAPSVNGLAPAAPQNSQPGMAPPPGAPVADAPPPAPLQLNGVVRRSDGKSTVWLNQQPQVDGSNALQNQTLSVRLSSGRQVILKAGQSFNPANETVQDDAGQ